MEGAAVCADGELCRLFGQCEGCRGWGVGDHWSVCGGGGSGGFPLGLDVCGSGGPSSGRVDAVGGAVGGARTAGGGTLTIPVGFVMRGWRGKLDFLRDVLLLLGVLTWRLLRVD